MERGNTPTPPLLDGIDRSSPPPACAICLGQFRNKSFAENCLHQFCFQCLLTWSKIKPECPLCKQPFRYIMHNVRANDTYEKYPVDEQEPIDTSPIYPTRFRYRATLTLHPRDNIAVQRLLMGYPNSDSMPRRRRSYSSFRRHIYRQNLWVSPLPDAGGRFRNCSPLFYRNNPAQVNRLVMWLSRELPAIVIDPTLVIMAIRRITDLVVIFPINSEYFREAIVSLIPVYTDHFIHEFYSFARSPYDIVGYDRVISYQSGGVHSSNNYVDEIISSDNESSTDSDVYLISPEAGPSNTTSNYEPRSYTPPGAPRPTSQRNLTGLSNPVVIETISHSETEESSDEVVMVRYIKPPGDRTPEVVDLVASDSDAVIIEESVPQHPIEVMDVGPNREAQNITSPLSLPSTSGLVKLSVKSNPSQSILLSDTNSESDSKSNNREKSKYLRWRYLKKKSNKDNASTECTDRDTNDDDSSCSSFTESYRISSMNNHTLKNSTQTKVTSVLIEKISKDNHFQSSSSVSNDYTKKHKMKSKKLSKKSNHCTKKKHKTKSKSKKRHRSRDKIQVSDKYLSKEKSSSSKIKGKKRPEETYDQDTKSLHAYWPRNGITETPSTSDNKGKEKRILKSVVNTVSVPVNGASSSYSFNGHSQPLSTYPDHNQYSSSDEEVSHNHYLGIQSYKPLDLRMKEWGDE